MPATKAKRRQGAKSRKKLLKAAVQVLGAEGYSGFSIDRIVRTAKVNRSALYWHFESKNGLLLATLGEMSRIWMEEFAQRTGEGASPLEQLDIMTSMQDSIDLAGSQPAPSYMGYGNLPSRPVQTRGRVPGQA